MLPFDFTWKQEYVGGFELPLSVPVHPFLNIIQPAEIIILARM